MKPNSSSISSSEQPSVAGKAQWKDFAAVAVATLLWIAAFDVAINVTFAPPKNPRDFPSSLQAYFEYGRSVESKLHAMIGDTRETTAPVATAGWIVPAEPVTAPTVASTPEKVLIAAYGQSFTQQAVEALEQVDPSFETRFWGGPGAPLSHSYALYRADKKNHDAKVIVIGVLASSMPRLVSLTNMTAWFEAPSPFTYPRFVWRDHKLSEIAPSIIDFDEMRSALRDPARWSGFVGELRKHDLAYRAFIFDSDLLDGSTLGRLARRAAGQKHSREISARYHDARGFTNRDGLLDVAEHVLARFAQEVRADGKLPWVLLFNDRGYDEHLVEALGPRLEKHAVPYYSSHRAAPPGDTQSFIADGHFRPDLGKKLAEEWRRDLVVALEQQAQKSP